MIEGLEGRSAQEVMSFAHHVLEGVSVAIDPCEVLKEAMARGADIDQIRLGSTFLFVAVLYLDPQAVRCALAFGADINKPCGSVWINEIDQISTLEFARQRDPEDTNYPELAKEILGLLEAEASRLDGLEIGEGLAAGKDVPKKLPPRA